MNPWPSLLWVHFPNHYIALLWALNGALRRFYTSRWGTLQRESGPRLSITSDPAEAKRNGGFGQNGMYLDRWRVGLLHLLRSDLKARTISRLYLRLNSSLEILFSSFLTNKEAQGEHMLACILNARTLHKLFVNDKMQIWQMQPRENHTLVQHLW